MTLILASVHKFDKYPVVVMEIFDKLPPVSAQKIAIKVKPAAERAVRQKHPWVFDGSITKQNITGKAGDVAILFDQKKNKFLALGLYDPFSPVRVKLLAFSPTQLNESWFQQTIEKAWQKRLPLLETATNSYRLIYGENDGLPGLIADVYDRVLVLKLYTFIWLPYLGSLVNLLLKRSGAGCCVLRLSRNLQARPDALFGLEEGMLLAGQLEDPEVTFKEHGLKLVTNVIKGHKTGFFLDHRHNRKRVGELSKGKKVLDVFSYAGGFSVHAYAGGAQAVVSLDISAQAQKMAQRNMALNFDHPAHKIMVADAFEGMKQLAREKQHFGLVIIDPPSFAKQESEKERALLSYKRLLRLAVPLVEANGILLMASCSSRISADDFFALIEQELTATGRPFVRLEKHFMTLTILLLFQKGLT
jgi:23S rRNA (cytosine1962-C5)-methyltransferase